VAVVVTVVFRVERIAMEWSRVEEGMEVRAEERVESKEDMVWWMDSRSRFISSTMPFTFLLSSMKMLFFFTTELRSWSFSAVEAIFREREEEEL